MAYLKAFLLLLVHGLHAGHSRDELAGCEGLALLLADPAICECSLDHLDYVSLRETVGDLGETADVQGLGEDATVALDDLLPQHCVTAMAGRQRGQ